jgi:hypothetical protein
MPVTGWAPNQLLSGMMPSAAPIMNWEEYWQQQRAAGANVPLSLLHNNQFYDFATGTNPSDVRIATGDTAGNYNAGIAPGSGVFASADPNEIADFSDAQRDTSWQGIGRVAALVGGGAALGNVLPPFSGAAPAATTGAATTFPYAAGGPVSVSSLAGAGGGAIAGGSMALSGLDWANIGTSILGLLGSKEAGDQQADAANNAAAGLERADLRARADLEPFRQAGGAALNPLVDFVTRGPETELERTEGFTNIQNSAAANGKLRSGGTLKGLTEFNSMLNSRNRNQRFNELFNLATLGSNSASRQATNTLGTASQVGELGTQAGNARAAGTVGGVNQLTNLFDNFVFMRALNQGG